MDVLQLVFAFLNAPLFATFLLGMFWKRTTGHGAFFGLLSGIAAAAVHHGLTIPEGSVPGIKGGWIAVVLFGLFTANADMYQRSLGININLWWGSVFLIFALLTPFPPPSSHTHIPHAP